MRAGGPRVVVFARRPARGQVKTRLAQDIGVDAALDFYRQTLGSLLRRLAPVPRWQTLVAVTPDDALGDAAFVHPQITAVPQGAGDLGERMLRFLEPASRTAPVLVVGSDVPALDEHHLHAALDALTQYDLVVGPAADGGYWLIGASAPSPATLFEHVRWSTLHALDDTLANAASMRLARLEVLEDVDDGAAYARHCERQGRR